MSQQTGVERIGEPWRRFVGRWPTPAELATAPTGELLAAWSGLGYNRRALALRAAARRIADEHGGAVPRRLDALAALPGLGPYTARAVAASAHGLAVAPLDVNVGRVVRRVTGLEAAGPASPRRLQAAADGLVSPRQPRRWLDAVTDLAALVCRPSPDCASCPLAGVCASAGAVHAARPRRSRPPAASRPFPATRRWLRGRLVAAAVAGGGEWVAIPDRLGAHGRPAVDEAAAGLAAEGFLELGGGAMRVAG